jgi:hypothetical protein
MKVVVFGEEFDKKQEMRRISCFLLSLILIIRVLSVLYMAEYVW